MDQRRVPAPWGSIPRFSKPSTSLRRTKKSQLFSCMVSLFPDLWQETHPLYPYILLLISEAEHRKLDNLASQP
jgi:hypothetical protein